jgi:hypothetical protein
LIPSNMLIVRRATIFMLSLWCSSFWRFTIV